MATVPVSGGGGGFNIGAAAQQLGGKGQGGQELLKSLVEKAKKDPQGPEAQMLQILQQLGSQQQDGAGGPQGAGGMAPAGGAGQAQQQQQQQEPDPSQIADLFRTITKLDPETQKQVIEQIREKNPALASAIQEALPKAGAPKHGGPAAVGKA